MICFLLNKNKLRSKFSCTVSGFSLSYCVVTRFGFGGRLFASDILCDLNFSMSTNLILILNYNISNLNAIVI